MPRSGNLKLYEFRANLELDRFRNASYSTHPFVFEGSGGAVTAAFRKSGKVKNLRKHVGHRLMNLVFFKKFSDDLKSSGPLYKIIGFSVSAIGFLAALLSLYQMIPSAPSDGEQLRAEAADCRAEGYMFLKQEKEKEARTSFQCAEQKFKEAINLNDDLSLWGLSNLYGDQVVHPLLVTLERRDLLADAAMYWCKARHASVPHAAGSPPFNKNLQC